MTIEELEEKIKYDREWLREQERQRPHRDDLDLDYYLVSQLERELEVMKNEKRI